MYRVIFLTVPPNFQYQNEKQSAANQRFCSIILSMYKRWWSNVSLFSTKIWLHFECIVLYEEKLEMMQQVLLQVFISN